MLASLRRSVRSGLAVLILFVALLALVITGFGTGGIGGLDSLSSPGGSEALARVDGRELSAEEVTDIVNRQFASARQQQPELDLGTYAAEAYEPIVNQLILALAVQAFGEEQGLMVSQRMIDREIVNIPAFRSFTGQFDDATFRRALAAQNITEAQLRQDIARSLMQRQLLGPVARGAVVPEGLAREYANLLLERRSGSIGVVPAQLMRAGIEPEAAEVAAFYQANRGRFAIPERRAVQYAMIGPEQVAAAATPSADEIAAFYRQNAARYAGSETRTLQHLPVQDAAQARTAVQQLRAGRSFAEVASALGFSADDLTYENRTQPAFAGDSAPAVAQAAFAAEQGAVVGPIASEGVFHIVRVEGISRSAARPLESVRGEIEATLRQRKLDEAMNALIDRIEDRLADGESLEEVARAERLELVTTPPITAAGQAPGQPFVFPAELAPLLRSAFEIDAEDPEPAIEQVGEGQRFALLGVERVLPAAPLPLAQIQDQVREALIQQRALERARAIARQIVDRINGGMAPAAAFAQAQPRLPAPEAVDLQRLEISRAGEQAPAPLIALFSLPQGGAHLMAAPNGAGWFVVHHRERTPGDAADRPELIATTRTEFARSAAEELAQQFARSVELASELERNAEAIQRTRQRLTGGGLD